MSRRFLAALLLVAAGLYAGGASAQTSSFQGLWVGEVEVSAVSSSNRVIEDMSFDLQLSRVRTVLDGNNQPSEESVVVVPTRASWCYWGVGAAGGPAEDGGGLAWSNREYADACGTPSTEWQTGSAEFGFGDSGDAVCDGGDRDGNACRRDSDCEGNDANGSADDGTCSDPALAGTVLDPTPVAGAGPARTAPFYFRHEFQHDDTDLYDHLSLSLIADDGAIVYLNGAEVARYNMPSAGGGDFGLRPLQPVSGDAEALFTDHVLEESGDDPVTDARGFPVILRRADLRNGTNVLAVQLHQYEYVPGVTDPSDPIPERAERCQTSPSSPGCESFSFRLIVHVDAAGNAHLLKEVIQMAQESPPEGVDPLVLVTIDERIPDFTGVTLVDGRPVGFRISSAAFDFECTPPPEGWTGPGPADYSPTCNAAANGIGLGSWTDVSDVLTATLADPANAPTNPFRHGFHPDHSRADDLIGVEREIELRFAASEGDVTGVRAAIEEPDWATSRVGGFYTETLTGLHRNTIRVRGTFLLNRATTVGELNPPVAPGGGAP